MTSGAVRHSGSKQIAAVCLFRVVVELDTEPVRVVKKQGMGLMYAFAAGLWNCIISYTIWCC